MSGKRTKKSSPQTRWLTLTVLWTTVIFALSAQPGTVSSDTSEGVLMRLLAVFGLHDLTPEQMNALHHIIRKCAHFTEYALLGALWSGYFRAIPARNAWGKAWLTATATASADELLQRFIEGRSGQLSDVLLDSTGAATGIACAWLLWTVWRKFSPRPKPLSDEGGGTAKP